MRVAIDTSVTEVTAGGSATYVRELVAAMRDVEPSNDYLELKYRPLFGRSRRMLRAFDTLSRELVWQQAVLPRLAARHQADVVHAPAFLAPARCRLPVVVSILDLYVLRQPSAFRAWHAGFTRVMLPRIVERADRIIAISRFTKRELLELFPKVPEEKVTVTHLGAHHRFHPRDVDESVKVADRLRLQRPFFLSVCTLEPRKNLIRLIQAFSTLREGLPHQLVLVGPVGWKTSGLFRVVRDLGSDGRVVALGHVDIEDLPHLYCAAEALVYPSMYEGFGLPPMEAMSCGCPVIASKMGSLPEVIEDAGVLVDPVEVGEITEAMLRLATVPTLRAALREKGLAQARKFSWSRCAAETLACYRAVL